MPQLAVCNMAGEKVGELEVPDELSSASRNHDLIHQALVTVDRKRQQHSGQTKTRAQIALTGAKVYRQKGLARARHGAQSAPIFVGGSKAHGPKRQPPRVSMPKKMRRKAVRSALGGQVAAGRTVIVDGIELDGIRTKAIVEMLAALRCRGKVLMLLSEEQYLDQYLYKSSRNIPKLVLREVPHFSVRDVLWADHIVMTAEALRKLGAGGEPDADD